MTKIYDQFDAATQDISAYAISKGAEYVGRIVFKYPRDGMGRQFAYVQVWGFPMVRGYASGRGYDKHSAAVESAVSVLEGDPASDKNGHVIAWRTWLSNCDGTRWDDMLKNAGYDVHAIV